MQDRRMLSRSLPVLMDRLVPVAIITNLVLLGLGSLWPTHEGLRTLCLSIYALSAIVFAVEYVVRVWRHNGGETHPKAFWGRIRFMGSVMMLIDLLALLSVPFFGLMNNAFFLRVFRLFKLTEGFGRAKDYSPAKLLVTTLTNYKEELLVTISMIFRGRFRAATRSSSE